MSFKRLISLFLCLSLLVACILPLASCKKDKNKDKGDNQSQTGNTGNNNNNNPGNNDTPAGNTRYTVTVKSVGGMPLEGVNVYVHKGDAWSPVSMPVETDANGQAVFDLPTSNDYSIQLDDAPKGYTVLDGMTRDERYPMSSNGALITLASAPIKGDIASNYSTGDVMHDFTLTDIDGNDYTLSELLKTKDMVMLNFWYVNCTNCLDEFPAINSVYQQYSDDMELLAINDYAPDTLASVETFSDVYGFDLKMPLFKITYGADVPTYDKFENSQGYPTTVIIDRYGVICLIVVGGISGESKWQRIFDHFIGDDYEQKLIENVNDLTPRVEATEKWVSSDNIASSLNGNDLTVTYRPEENDVYSWPFTPTMYDGVNCVKPSNALIDNSYSILYADVELNENEAITFDYFSSTEADSDYLHIIVDGNLIFSIYGVEDEGWKTACAYVALEAGTYELAFVYQKDDDGHAGDDTVYIANLKAIPLSDIPVDTHIFRYAATDPTDDGSGFGTYADVVLNENDGLYHVGNANGPLLLVNHLGYTLFDPDNYLSYRVHLNYELFVDETDENGDTVKVNRFQNWLIYGNCAANSEMFGYTPVTEELKNYLQAYCETYRLDVGKEYSENLWLQLCVYYDAYGPTVEHLDNPIKGLCDFCAFDAVVDNPDTVEIETNTVTYDRVIMPRGLLYKFTPTKSGVYRITSISDIEVIGWVFSGNRFDWAKLEDQDRTIHTDSNTEERYTPELIIDKNGVPTLDINNISMVGYFEAGVDYYVDIAYYEVNQEGTFEFKIQWVNETFDYFIQSSPGPVTYIESANGGMGQLIAEGIDYIFVEDTDGVEYAYELKGYDNNGDPIIGKKIYADFFYPTIHFQTQSIQALIKANAFNFNITETDREAIVVLESIKLLGTKIYEEKNGSGSLEALGLATIPSDILYAVINAAVNGTSINQGAYTQQQIDAIRSIVNEGIAETKKDWAITNVASLSTYAWNSNNMDEAVRGVLSTDPAIRAAQESYLAEVNSEFAKQWAYYQMNDVLVGIYHTTDEDRMTDKDILAKEYLDYLNTYGKDALKEYWDANYDFVKPSADENVSDVSEWRFNYMWEYYQMDDVKAGVYHGIVKDFTERIKYYESLMDNNPNHPERQGCVEVTRELAEILSALFEKYVFEDTIDSWLKFCFYYQELGV